MTTGTRRAAFVVACVAAVGAIAVIGILASHDDSGAGAPRTIERGDLMALSAGRDDEHLMVFRGRSPRADHAVTPLTCDRAAFGGDVGVCLAQDRAVPVVTYAAKFFDRRQRVVATVPVVGYPSRARISPGGRYAATTSFVDGDAYVSSGFSTRTVIFDARRHTILADLESLRVTRNGKPFRRQDFNFWGVTFDGDAGRFYATLATGGHRYLVRGDIRTRRATVLRDGVECPSLSPDRTRIAFKARVGQPWRWQIHILDLATGHVTAIPDPDHSVDDQTAWLDNATIAYNRGRTIVSAPADGSARPTTFLTSANSAAIAQ